MQVFQKLGTSASGPSLLQRMTAAGQRPSTLGALNASYRCFAVHPQVIAPRSITALEEIGRSNLALTKQFGLDYETILSESG